MNWPLMILVGLLSYCQLSLAKIYHFKDTFNPLLEPQRILFVEPGDSLFDLAERHHTTVGHLLMTNPKLTKKPKPWTRIVRLKN